MVSRRRGARRARAAAALARADEQHLGPPPRPRPRLRHRRHRLQLPPGRAARRARAEPPGSACRRRSARAARPSAPTASGSPGSPAWSCASTSRRSSAPRTSRSPCCSPTASARDRFRDQLKDAGIQTTWYPALHSFSDYRGTHLPDGLPRATEVADRHCALPLSSSTMAEEVEIVVEAVRSALS